jgi:hypothetical protein
MKNKIIIIVVIALFYFLYLLVNYRKEDRKRKFVTTIGTITNVIWGHKNGRYIVQANFKVNGFVLYTSALTQCAETKLKYLYNKLKGKGVLVVYDSTNINNSQLLIDEEGFKEYNINMPDSLKWIDSLTTCKK